MSKNTKNYDTSTVCDQLLQKWLDQYPPEKTALLQDKYLALGKPIREYTEKLTALRAAKDSILSAAQTLDPYAKNLETYISQIQSYTRELDIVEQGITINFAEITQSLDKITSKISKYILDINQAYFFNLRQVELDIEGLKSLQNFYQTLFNIIATIRDSYFKTPLDRRKPIIRDLCRLFQSLADNNGYGNVCPDVQDKTTFAVSLDKVEFDSIRRIGNNALDAVKILKKSR